MEEPSAGREGCSRSRGHLDPDYKRSFYFIIKKTLALNYSWKQLSFVFSLVRDTALFPHGTVRLPSARVSKLCAPDWTGEMLSETK